MYLRSPALTIDNRHERADEAYALLRYRPGVFT